MSNDSSLNQLNEIASRIREMRTVFGWSVAEMAEKTEVSVSDYEKFENAEADLPFTFVHKCALAFGIELTELLEGSSPRLSSYTVTRRGTGEQTAKEKGITISSLAPKFRGKLAEPYWVTYEYRPELLNKPIKLTKHSGQEFDLILQGKLKVQVGEHTEVLCEGDIIFYNSSTPHGMIAVDGKDCVFLAVVLNGENTDGNEAGETILAGASDDKLICEKFVECKTDEHGALLNIKFKNEETFNFGFDVVDAIADKTPDKLAMLHLDRDKNERRFTFKDIKKASI